MRHDRIRNRTGRLAILEGHQADVQLGLGGRQRQRLAAVDDGRRHFLLGDDRVRLGGRPFLFLLEDLFLFAGRRLCRFRPGGNVGSKIELEMIEIGIPFIEQAGRLRIEARRKSLVGDLPAPLVGGGIRRFPDQHDLSGQFVEVPFRFCPGGLGRVRHDHAEGELDGSELERLGGGARGGWQLAEGGLRARLNGLRRFGRRCGPPVHSGGQQWGRRRQHRACAGRGANRGGRCSASTFLCRHDAQGGGPLAGKIPCRDPHDAHAGHGARQHAHDQSQLPPACRLGRADCLDAVAQRENGSRIQVAAGDENFVGASGGKNRRREGLHRWRQAGRRPGRQGAENRGRGRRVSRGLRV